MTTKLTQIKSRSPTWWTLASLQDPPPKGAQAQAPLQRIFGRSGPARNDPLEMPGTGPGQMADEVEQLPLLALMMDADRGERSKTDQKGSVADSPGPLVSFVAEQRQSNQSSSRAEVLALLWLAGGLLALVGLALPQTDGVNRLGNDLTALMGIPAALGLVVLRRRLPSWSYHVILAAGTIAVGCGIFFEGGGIGSIAASAIFVWVALYAGYFFAPWQLAVQLSLMIAVDIGALQAHMHTGEAAGAAVVLGVAVVAGGVASYLSGKLRRQAITDPLTGALNRQGFALLLEAEINRAARSKEPLSLAVIDLDSFKYVNDSYGHQVGDRLLASLVERWRPGLRKVDVLARYGGDEFVAILPNCDLDRARGVMERLSKEGGYPCSIGLAQWQSNEDSESLVSRADQAQRAAKSTGKARVATAELSSPSPRLGASSLAGTSPSTFCS
ncbi:MAG: GGDEF domain-containing protein [Actinobacteria bacterium]|nr:GGDEF domain-containing protein [Actinomycetota bacterium]